MVKTEPQEPGLGLFFLVRAVDVGCLRLVEALIFLI